mmetsp:Transcript_37425/g.116580  ORF Transcript_37425/g.116580 Transcript_37425/m.116580 type:complete len:442 (+) Transcript_37425:3-1328(+)
MQYYERNCSMPPSLSPPGGGACWYPEMIPCCPRVFPFTVWKQRQAFDPLLLQRIVSLYPLSPSQGLTAGGLPPPFMAPPAKVWAGLTVFRIFDVDQRSQTFKMHHRLKGMYRDCRVLNACNTMMMDTEHPLWSALWKPAWMFEEMQSTHGSMKRDRVRFSPDGLVHFEAEGVSSFKCAFDFRAMPFDKQTCHITLMVPILDASNLKMELLVTSEYKVVNVMDTHNAEWYIPSSDTWNATNIEVTREVNGNLLPTSALRWTFHLERRSRSMVMNFIAPSVLYYSVSWLGLWIDATAVPARAAIGTLPVLMMTNQIGTLSGIIPPLSYSVRLENFLRVTLAFTVLQMLEFGFVNYAQRRKRARSEERESRPPGEPQPLAGTEALPLRPSRLPRPSWQQVSAIQKRPLAVSDRLVRALADKLDMHMRWIMLLAYTLTCILILAS